VTANAAAADLPLAPDTLAELADATAEVAARLGDNADMWQTTPRLR